MPFFLVESYNCGDAVLDGTWICGLGMIPSRTKRYSIVLGLFVPKNNTVS